MKTFRELLFPTPIYQKEFPDAKNLNKHLAKHSQNNNIFYIEAA